MWPAKWSTSKRNNDRVYGWLVWWETLRILTTRFRLRVDQKLITLFYKSYIADKFDDSQHTHLFFNEPGELLF